MDHTNHIDSPDYRHIENNEDWLDEILAMELDAPSVAAASSEGAATAGTTITTAVDEVYSSLVYTGVDDQLECTTGSGIATAGLGWSAAAYGVSSLSLIDSHHPRHNTSASSTAAAPTTIVVCHRPTDIPTGRQPARILQCGICMTDTLFDRRYELERHMATHVDGNHPCLHHGCPYIGARAFKRTEHLRNHRRRIHGI
ncbi:hypothetical protein LTR15_001341 [Elasticomyces elasticus]|nr:hypothetical protein LTR15_001341 [Elasticomyces elasticus]